MGHEGGAPVMELSVLIKKKRTSRSVNLMIRGIVLFFIGVFLALVLNLLQVQRNVTLFPPDVIASIFSSAWWVPPCCGTASGMCGLFL